ncbi:ferredoxin [Mycobacterium sp. 94-17]|uniref:ferredoxin n=1 Tax=Mycobacterium sp. 94-17 TaxID=2986147 RepID=UPI002D1F4459|nr:ferredoxin [Mycobacterium sp. 94-17]MEB4209759.1 ferredoxin [Mycobacterium sp. 94-17]
MKLHVDPGLCQGHARCLMLVPEAFDFDDENDLAVVKSENIDSVPKDRLEHAVESCPERAIIWATSD